MEHIFELKINIEEATIQKALKYGLDSILFPSYAGADISARAGYPSIAVPEGFQDHGRAFGITFTGTAFSEKTLI